MKRIKVLSLGKKDFRVTTYRGTGNGGQKKNVTDSAVRIVHIESGAEVKCESGRSQHKNKAEAFKKFKTNITFLKWISVECEISRAEECGDILTEVFRDGEWGKLC